MIRNEFLHVLLARLAPAAVRCGFLGLLWNSPLAAAGEAAGRALEARVAPCKGRNVFFVNGRPMAPLMYSGTEHSRETWAGRPRKSIEEFTALGYEIIQTDLWLKYSLRPDGTFDMDGVRRQLAGILGVNSNAMIVVRINVSAPGWWLDQNPAERCRVTLENPDAVRFGGNSAESLASEKYAAFAREHLRRFLEELSKTPEGDRVMGFHIGGGVYGEWHYYGIDQEPDASGPMRRKFAAFAAGRYGGIDAINAAWRTTFGSVEDIVVPSYARRYEAGDGDFRDPAADRYVIDYYECQQATVSSLVNGLAEIVRRTWPRPAVIGLFYGYFYGAWTVGAQASQFDIETMFNSPYVDYFSGPYSSRNVYGSGLFRSLADSVALHGKVWISEHDGGTHLGHVGDVRFPDLPRTEAESVALMRRNFMYALTDNAGQWWYDFGPQNRSGWWSSPALLAEAGRLLQLANMCMERPYEKPADVLAVFDMKSFNYVRPARADRLTFKATEAMTDTLLGTGAAMDRIFLMDLKRADLSRYKLVIFANTFALGAAHRAYIRERVMQNGRTVVFMSGAGYTDGQTNDVRLISDLVGMSIEKAVDGKGGATVSLGGKAYPLDVGGVISRFKVSGDHAEAIGTYSSGEPCAAVKAAGGATVYYFGVPLKAPLDFFKALLVGAGVRTCVDGTVERDYAAVGGGVIALYSVNGGRKTVRPLGGPTFTITVPPFSSSYFDIRTGARLLPEYETSP